MFLAQSLREQSKRLTSPTWASITVRDSVDVLIADGRSAAALPNEKLRGLSIADSLSNGADDADANLFAWRTCKKEGPITSHAPVYSRREIFVSNIKEIFKNLERKMGGERLTKINVKTDASFQGELISPRQGLGNFFK